MTATVDTAVQISQSSSLEQTTMPAFSLTYSDAHDYLENKNLQFVSSLAPTLSYVLVLLLFGLVGNTLVFLVYFRRFKPSVTRTYILAMSVCDLMTNVLSLPADMVEVRFHNTFDNSSACKLFRTVKSFLSFWSACVLVAVAIDRQRSICSPRSKPTTVKHIGIILAMSAGLAFASTVPYTILTGKQTVHFEDSNITGARCSIDDVYVKSRFLSIYNMVMGVVFVICIIIMIVSYVRIARQLWLHKRNTTVTGRALGNRGASTQPTHTYIDEETSVDRAQQSLDARDQASSGAESDHKGFQLQEDKAKFSYFNTSFAPVDTPDTTNCVPAPKDETNQMSGPTNNKSDTRTNVCGTILTNADSKTLGMANLTSTGNKQSVASSTVSVINVDDDVTTAAFPKKSGRKSLRSRSILSGIRRTASDAKSFVTSKMAASAKPRGSVKKIPTRTTFMMFVLTVIFIINYLPYLVIVSLRAKIGMEPLLEDLGLNGYHVGLRSYFINSAVNPLVYSFCSARFRQECQRLFNCKRR